MNEAHIQCTERCLALEAERDALHEKVRVLREALADSIDSIEGWGAYASEYFQGKHKLRDELAQRRAALEATKEKP